ncbi:MAG TPA: phosphoribosylformylglycinamidine synthase I [Anaerolineae bacterium]|nr:phosphoribosylformylglycinamidine synthase I [Anaerolineae bacterium]HQK14912.1 phosphoribosylformylglycinamidine synthase I [Anaerolineae bacterium]
MTIKPNVLILQATGTNRDPDAAAAIELAGGIPTVLHINALHADPARLHDYQMLVLPGGFSYGDALGAGRLLAADMRWLFQEELARFVEAGKPVIGICNGFQALVKSGWLPGLPPSFPPTGGDERGGGRATLTRNASNRFECRWVWLEPNPDSPCVFTRGLTERIYCPVAHGEGRFVPRDEAVLADLRANGQIVVTYTTADGNGPVDYPDNPNGSTADIAGICNPQGTIFGLMPHPEDHIFPEQHPRYARGEHGNLGLSLFTQGLRYAAEV